MKRDIQQLKQNQFDLVVIGAGVHGACVARDASLRGMSVALIDQGDICGATSHNSLKTIHGGIRYLQHLNIARTWASIREQRYWLLTAPHSVKPLPFMMPTYGHGMRGPLAMFIGIMLYAIIGLGRNAGLKAQSKIRFGRVVSAKECQKIAKGIDSNSLSGAAIWDDAQVEDADQTVLEITEHAYQQGAVIANYVAATDFIIDNKTVKGIKAEDKLSGEVFEVKGRCVVNATGPWISEQIAQSKLAKPVQMNVPLVKSMNIVTKNKISDHAISFYSQHQSDSKVGNTKRLYFSVPWKNYTMFGTTHFPHDNDNAESHSDQSEIQSFVDEINIGYPSLNLNLEDVLYCYQGLTPADAADDSSAVTRLHESKVVDHGSVDKIENLVSIVSIKWTTARRVAEECTNLIAKKIGNTKRCETRHTLIPPLACSRELAHLDDTQLKVHCLEHIEQSMSVKLRDFLLRRTDDFICNKLNEHQLQLILTTFSEHYDWSQQRQLEEINALQNSFLSQQAQTVLYNISETLL